MIERLPQIKFEDLKVGESIIVSSSQGATPAEVTAITLLDNADMLIRMAQAQQAQQQAGGRGQGAAGAGPSLSMGGLGGGGMGGLDLGGIMP